MSRVSALLARPVQRLRAWARRSVLNRLTAISMGTSLLLMAAVALVAFPLFYGQIRSNDLVRNRNNLERVSDHLHFRLTTVLEALDELANNSFVVNAFVDSSGRDLYLVPTLRDYRPPFRMAQTLTLLDSNLTVFADTRADRGLANHEKNAARLALQDGKTRLVFFSDIHGAPRLLIAEPVYYPPASAHEGVLLASLDARVLLGPAAELVGPTECVTVSSGDRLLLSKNCDARGLSSQLSKPISTQHQLAGDVALTITYGDEKGMAFGVLALIAAAYLVFAALALLIAFVATRAIGRPFANKLEELAQTANALAANPASTARVQWEHSDEIGRLTLAFGTMVDQWREIQASLEERVRERTEELRAALARAQQSSHAKSEFLAVMSHEIRTPMNGVLGMLQVLETTDLTETQRRHLQVIRGSSDLLLRVIDDLLDFFRTEAGKLPLEVAPLQMDLLLRDLVALLAPTAALRGVDLVLQPIALDLSEPVIGDATRLRQIFTNLIQNAIKFTAPGGHVQVSATMERRNGMQHFVYSVADTGVGIEASQKLRIFEPFEQADRSTTRQFGGSGLGLAIVKRLVQLMGGSIDVTSEPHKGSTFVVTLDLPMARQVLAADSLGEPSKRASFARLRVLMVEDDLTNQVVATAMLESLGINHVTTAENGREAVDVATRERFDLILMDCHMPVMDGYSATRALRESGIETPIVAMTANVLPEERTAFFDAGMVDYVSKPMDRLRLSQVIERCAGGPLGLRTD